MDFLKPLQYALEKQVVSRNIPDVSSLTDRWKFLPQFEDPQVDHSLWDQVLKRHVYPNCNVGSMGGCHAVDYDGIAQDPEFAAYLDQLAKMDLAVLSRPEQLALWINAYNALCISLIVKADSGRESRLQSITELSNDTDGPVWDQIAGTVGGLELSLNDIEHVQLRSHWDEPSIHACIVCASVSCPNLRREAFVAQRLREQMNSQVREWLAHPSKGLCLKEDQLWLSKIFLWFGDDFGNNLAISNFPFFGSVWAEKNFRGWLAQFLMDKALATRVEYGNDGLRYLDYDWTLNRWINQGTEETSSGDGPDETSSS